MASLESSNNRWHSTRNKPIDNSSNDNQQNVSVEGTVVSPLRRSARFQPQTVETTASIIANHDNTLSHSSNETSTLRKKSSAKRKKKNDYSLEETDDPLCKKPRTLSGTKSFTKDVDHCNANDILMINDSSQQDLTSDLSDLSYMPRGSAPRYQLRSLVRRQKRREMLECLSTFSNRSLETLPMEVCHHIFQYLSINDLYRIRAVSSRLKHLVDVHLWTLKRINFCNGFPFSYLSDRITDETLRDILRRSPQVTHILGFYPRYFSSQNSSELTLNGVITLFRHLSKLRSIEIMDVSLLSRVGMHLPQVKFHGMFRNRPDLWDQEIVYTPFLQLTEGSLVDAARNGATSTNFINITPTPRPFGMNTPSFTTGPGTPRTNFVSSPRLTMPNSLLNVTKIEFASVCLPSLPRMDNLKYLSLRSVRFTTTTPFNHLQMPKLQTFIMNNCCVGSRNVRHLRILPELARAPHLSRMEISSCRLLVSLVEAMIDDNSHHVGFVSFSRLNRLVLSGLKDITSRELGLLFLAGQRSLQHIAMEGPLITTAEFLALANTNVQMTKLEYLCLGYEDPLRFRLSQRELKQLELGVRLGSEIHHNDRDFPFPSSLFLPQHSAESSENSAINDGIFNLVQQRVNGLAIRDRLMAAADALVVDNFVPVQQNGDNDVFGVQLFNRQRVPRHTTSITPVRPIGVLTDIGISAALLISPLLQTLHLCNMPFLRHVPMWHPKYALRLRTRPPSASVGAEETAASAYMQDLHRDDLLDDFWAVNGQDAPHWITAYRSDALNMDHNLPRCLRQLAIAQHQSGIGKSLPPIRCLTLERCPGIILTSFEAIFIQDLMPQLETVILRDMFPPRPLVEKVFQSSNDQFNNRIKNSVTHHFDMGIECQMDVNFINEKYFDRVLSDADLHNFPKAKQPLNVSNNSQFGVPRLTWRDVADALLGVRHELMRWRPEQCDVQSFSLRQPVNQDRPEYWYNGRDHLPFVYNEMLGYFHPTRHRLYNRIKDQSSNCTNKTSKTILNEDASVSTDNSSEACGIPSPAHSSTREDRNNTLLNSSKETSFIYCDYYSRGTQTCICELLPKNVQGGGLCQQCDGVIDTKVAVQEPSITPTRFERDVNVRDAGVDTRDRPLYQSIPSYHPLHFTQANNLTTLHLENVGITHLWLERLPKLRNLTLLSCPKLQSVLPDILKIDSSDKVDLPSVFWTVLRRIRIARCPQFAFRQLLCLAMRMRFDRKDRVYINYRPFGNYQKYTEDILWLNSNLLPTCYMVNFCVSHDYAHDISERALEARRTAFEAYVREAVGIDERPTFNTNTTYPPNYREYNGAAVFPSQSSNEKHTSASSTSKLSFLSPPWMWLGCYSDSNFPLQSQTAPVGLAPKGFPIGSVARRLVNGNLIHLGTCYLPSNSSSGSSAFTPNIPSQSHPQYFPRLRPGLHRVCGVDWEVTNEVNWPSDSLLKISGNNSTTNSTDDNNATRSSSTSSKADENVSSQIDYVYSQDNCFQEGPTIPLEASYRPRIVHLHIQWRDVHSTHYLPHPYVPSAASTKCENRVDSINDLNARNVDGAELIPTFQSPTPQLSPAFVRGLQGNKWLADQMASRMRRLKQATAAYCDKQKLIFLHKQRKFQHKIHNRDCGLHNGKSCACSAITGNFGVNEVIPIIAPEDGMEDVEYLGDSLESGPREALPSDYVDHRIDFSNAADQGDDCSPRFHSIATPAIPSSISCQEEESQSSSCSPSECQVEFSHSGLGADENTNF